MRSLGVLLLVLVTTVTAQDNSSCIDGDVDLIQDEGRSEIVGYVRYCWEGQWRSVCRQGGFYWDSNEARVACRQLGYQGDGSGSTCPSGVGATLINETFIVTLCNAALNGTESSLQDCMIKTVDSCRCHRTARLVCDPVCTSGDLRLVSNNSTPGNVEVCVEVCVGGRWGTLQTNYSGELAEYVCGSITQSPDLFISTVCYGCCADHQQGHYRVENGTVLQVCVDQQWRTVENTSQLLTLLQQEDIDQLFKETLTQCSSKLVRLNNAKLIPSTCTGVIQDSIDQLINKTLTTQCPTTPPITESSSSYTVDVTEDKNEALNTQCPTTIPPSTTTVYEGQSTLSSSEVVSTTYLVVIAILAVSLLLTVTGWITTCVVVWKKRRCNDKQSNLDEVTTVRNESYFLHQIQQQHSEATPTDHTHPPATGPNYETVLPTETDTYNRLNHTPQPPGPPPTRDKSHDNNNTGDTQLYSVITDKDEPATGTGK